MMGGTMPFGRALGRNRLYATDYAQLDDPIRSMIAGDFARFLRDTFAQGTLEEYAEMCRTSPDVVLRVLRVALDVPEPGCDVCNTPPAVNHYYARCDFHSAKMTMGEPGVIR